MQNRALSLVLAGLLTVGAVAGCSSKKSSSSPTTGGTTPTTVAGGGGGGGGSSAKVKEYCDAVDAFVIKAKEVMKDPTKAGTLTQESTDLATKAGQLAAGLTSAEAQQVSDCSAKAAKALTPG